MCKIRWGVKEFTWADEKVTAPGKRKKNSMPLEVAYRHAPPFQRKNEIV